HHVQAFPGPQLKKLIFAEGLLAKLVQAGYRVKGANAYLSNYENLIASRKYRHSATTLTLLGAGLPLASVEELRQGKAVYQDITNEMAAALESDVPIISPCQAGKNLAQITQQHHFTLYEYFQTDRYGHKQDWQMAEKIVRYIDELLWGFWREAAGDCTLLLVSDHGNFEDLSVKTHTINKVPLLLMGPASRKLAEQITDFSSVAQTIFSVMQGERENG
ncbi:MAG: metalloenzyme, partial [Sporomusaceae bacterium]|nr:metalloenzyme [Sporomusaceae bacterium]